MLKKDLLTNIGKTLSFKTHRCLEKLRLVADADNLKVPQFPKAQVYRLPIQVPGFPSENSIFPLKSFPPLQRRTTIPSSAINYGERKAHSHPHHPHPHPLNLPSSLHRLTVKEKPNFSSSSSSPPARSSTASTKCYRINRQRTNACTDT